MTRPVTPAGAMRRARENLAVRAALPNGGSYGCWWSVDGRVCVKASQKRVAPRDPRTPGASLLVWVYDVGTTAQSLAKGSAVEVTLVLQRLLDGERFDAPPVSGERRGEGGVSKKGTHMATAEWIETVEVRTELVERVGLLKWWEMSAEQCDELVRAEARRRAKAPAP